MCVYDLLEQLASRTESASRHFLSTVTTAGIYPSKSLSVPVYPSALIFDRLREKAIITPQDLKAHLIATLQDLRSSKSIPDLNALSDTEVSDLTTFLTQELAIKENGCYSIDDRRQAINQHLETFCELRPKETITDRQILLSWDQLLQHWPFLAELLVEFSYPRPTDDHSYLIDLTMVADRSIEFSVAKSGVGRYHAIVHMADEEQSQIVICYSPQIGYISQTFVKGLSRSITQYDQDFRKCHNEFYYEGGELRQIYAYKDGRLNGETLCLINRQICAIIPFVDDQPHGLMKILDASQKLIFKGIYYYGQPILTEFDLPC